jgi:hypothetical protein
LKRNLHIPPHYRKEPIVRLARLLLVAALAVLPSAASAQGGVPLGPEFRVNTDWDYDQGGPSVASDSAGNFVVVWHSGWFGLLPLDVFGQRYASTGAPLGGEFSVSTPGFTEQYYPSVASDVSGNSRRGMEQWRGRLLRAL